MCQKINSTSQILLQLVLEELALDMPGLYGSAGMVDLIPVPLETLRAVIEAFDDPELESCWTDDMTLGWVYQFWNDPDREALDAKINDGGKIEPHEIASKTQMFTERYIIDWLLQNSLGPMWLAMCRKHGWTPECESSGTLERLEQRCLEWRALSDQRQTPLTSRSSLPERTSQPVATSDHAGSMERQRGDVERTSAPQHGSPCGESPARQARPT